MGMVNSFSSRSRFLNRGLVVRGLGVGRVGLFVCFVYFSFELKTFSIRIA